MLKGCDFLILPTTPDSLAIEALQLTIEALGGLSYLFTDTSIYDNEGLDYEEIASDINFDDAKESN